MPVPMEISRAKVININQKKEQKMKILSFSCNLLSKSYCFVTVTDTKSSLFVIFQPLGEHVPDPKNAIRKTVIELNVNMRE